MAAAFVPPLSQLVIEDISGARDRLAELSLLGLRVLAPLPLILVQEQVFASALMQVRRTRPILYVNVWRLAALLVFVVLALGVGGTAGRCRGRRRLGGQPDRRKPWRRMPMAAAPIASSRPLRR